MPRYLYVYHGGKAPASPEEGKAVMAKWNAWMGGMGDKLVEGGAPVGLSKTVSPSGVSDNGGANPASGWTVVKASGYDEAVEMAKGCPILQSEGSVEVAEVMEM